MNFSFKVSELFLIKVAVRRVCRDNFCTKTQVSALMSLFDKMVKDIIDAGHICSNLYF